MKSPNSQVIGNALSEAGQKILSHLTDDGKVWEPAYDKDGNPIVPD